MTDPEPMQQAVLRTEMHGKSSGRTASIGILWVTISMIFTRGLSLISQVILGYALAVETYAIFGLAASVLALTASFQNPNVGKALIQRTSRFSELFPIYSAFAFQFGLVGAFLLTGLGAAFAEIYETPQLLAILFLTGLSFPLLSVNSTLIASMSLAYRFRDINITEMKRSLAYSVALVGAALMGAEALTLAIATVIGSFVGHILLLDKSGLRPSYFRLHPRDFIATIRTLRWVILSSFLLALAMRSDYFVIAKLVSMRELGYYSFAFMLVANATLPISTGINQVFLPMFSRLQNDTVALRQEVVRFGSAIVLLGSILCLLLLGLSEVLINMLWGGKWDPAHFVVLVLGIATPFRFMGTIAGVGIEARGRWRLRNGLLVFEAALLTACAAVGALLQGVEGAIIGVLVQRVLSSLVGFAALGRLLRLDGGAVAVLTMRIYAPFIAASSLLLGIAPIGRDGKDDLQTLGSAILETLFALTLFSVLAFICNRDFLHTGFDLVRKQIRRN